MKKKDIDYRNLDEIDDTRRSSSPSRRNNGVAQSSGNMKKHPALVGKKYSTVTFD